MSKHIFLVSNVMGGGGLGVVLVMLWDSISTEL